MHCYWNWQYCLDVDTLTGDFKPVTWSSELSVSKYRNKTRYSEEEIKRYISILSQGKKKPTKDIKITSATKMGSLHSRVHLVYKMLLTEDESYWLGVNVKRFLDPSPLSISCLYFHSPRIIMKDPARHIYVENKYANYVFYHKIFK